MTILLRNICFQFFLMDRELGLSKSIFVRRVVSLFAICRSWWLTPANKSKVYYELRVSCAYRLTNVCRMNMLYHKSIRCRCVPNTQKSTVEIVTVTWAAAARLAGRLANKLWLRCGSRYGCTRLCITFSMRHMVRQNVGELDICILFASDKRFSPHTETGLKADKPNEVSSRRTPSVCVLVQINNLLNCYIYAWS